MATDVAQHLHQQSDKAPPAEKIYWMLAAGYTEVWADDREAALVTLNRGPSSLPPILSCGSKSPSCIARCNSSTKR